MKLCSVCKKQKTAEEMGRRKAICKACLNARARARYASLKGKLRERICSHCKKLTTNFSPAGTVCRPCLAKARRLYNASRKTGISEAMIIQWKAGISFEDALSNIKLRNKNV